MSYLCDWTLFHLCSPSRLWRCGTFSIQADSSDLELLEWSGSGFILPRDHPHRNKTIEVISVPQCLPWNWAITPAAPPFYDPHRNYGPSGERGSLDLPLRWSFQPHLNLKFSKILLLEAPIGLSITIYWRQCFYADNVLRICWVLWNSRFFLFSPV